jgi:hypothetical protein
MEELVRQYIEAYRETLEAEIGRRRAALNLADQAANLGTRAIEKGIRRLSKEAGLSLKDLEKSNKQLSKQVARRVRKIDQRLCRMPDAVERERARRIETKKACAEKEELDDPCRWRPLAIFAYPVISPSGCRVEIGENEALGRTYPVVVVTGTGTNRLRTAEVFCAYLWEFVPDSTGVYAISAELQFSGRIVQTREYHCYADTSGTGWEYELRMGHDQAGGPTSVSPLEGTLPRGGGAMRYDGIRTANHMAMLEAGRSTYVFVTQRFTVHARSRYASVSFNFGDPSPDNYIDVPWMCWSRF